MLDSAKGTYGNTVGGAAKERRKHTGWLSSSCGCSG